MEVDGNNETNVANPASSIQQLHQYHPLEVDHKRQNDVERSELLRYIAALEKEIARLLERDKTQAEIVRRLCQESNALQRQIVLYRK